MSQLSENLYNKGSRNSKYAYATFPSIKVYKKSSEKAWSNHLLFGDYIRILDTTIVNNRIKVKSRNTVGWVKVDEIQTERVLEVNFVDVGQGDGCHVVTPDDKHILIDAGKSDHMNRYLTWRFNLYNKTAPLSFPFTIIISHSDTDHYKGFGTVFDNDKIKVDTVYHNGLVERPGPLPLGTEENGTITGIVSNTTEMKAIIEDSNNRKGDRSTYSKTLFKAFKNSPNIEFVSLSNKNQFLPGFDSSNTVNNKENSFKILGPILSNTNGKDALITISNLGKDKNGHSVILKLVYDKARILLGGDVNTEFGKMIHEHYDALGALDELTVDVAKACHHGSNHFHYEFIEDINASATVISSGDDESYSHPRPDAMGALGKCGYGKKPLIFSTELARSNKEITFDKLEEIGKLLEKINKTEKALKTETDPDEITKLKTARTKTNKKLNSFLTKFGMINVRTDGQKLIIAQKYEVQAAHGKWDIHEMAFSPATGRMELIDH